MNIAIFASGRGSNFSAIAKAVKTGKIKANLRLLVCDNEEAQVIRKARRAKVEIALVKRELFDSKEDFEAKIIKHLKENKIGLIVLAGFMRMLSHDFVKLYKGRIINIHPSLLPSFKGAHAIKDAFDYGVRLTGVTVHFVDEKMDHGPVILQAPVEIRPKDTLASLESRIHKLEHRLYPEAINMFLNKRMVISGRKIRIVYR
ncbi:MAG: phosphoribosylglycinamide formyltransferase [Candidatus Omnitrophota bacterium]|nr:MAG: phosphoribosylglycinamide formyltransferase [Candidatus Omnitrophota bacterium]